MIPQNETPPVPETAQRDHGTVQSLVRLTWDDPKWWPARCPVCGWEGMSNETAGGAAIADTGDYTDVVCPVCIAPDGNYENGRFVPVEEIPKPNTSPEVRR